MDISFNITLIIVIVTSIISYLAFQDKNLKEKLLFWPYAVKENGEYHRFLTSGFIHADWIHLLFNMFVLFSFGGLVEQYYKVYFGIYSNLLFLILYFGSMIAADAYTYYQHKEAKYYRSLGASGAVSGILFAFILFDPLAPLMIFPIPIAMPAIVLGIGYLAYSAYMARRSSDNINHDAHFYGAVFGVLLTLALNPKIGWQFVHKVASAF